MANTKNRKVFFNTTIPIDWDAHVLNEISEKIMVGIASAATHAYRETGIILFRNQNIKDGYLDDSEILFIDEEYEKAHRNKRLKGGDLLIARTGYPGTACLVPEKFSGAQSFTTLIARPNHNIVNKEYLCLYINSEYGQGYFETNQIGGGQKNVNAGTLEFMPIPLPPLPEQRAIAHILGLMDSAINANNQLIAQKELRKKWLMQNLLTGKKRLKGFEGEWKEFHLGEMFTERNETKYFDLPLLSVGANGIYPQSDSIKKDTSNEDKSKYKRICPGDIGYNTMRMWQGRSALSDLEGIVSPAYTIVTPKKNADSFFFSHLFKTPKLTHLFWRNSQGLVDDTLNCKFKDFEIVKVLLPKTKEEQTAIAQVLQGADKEIQLLKTKTEKLREQKKGMMQVLLTGKKRLVTEE